MISLLWQQTESKSLKRDTSEQKDAGSALEWHYTWTAENIWSMIRLASLSIISASVSSRYGRINYRRCRAEPAKQFSPEAGRLPGPIEAYRSPHLEYSIPLAIFRNGYSIFTMVDKRTGEPRVEKKKEFEIGGVWSFSKYSTVKRGMLPRFRGSKKEGGAPRSIFAYELRAISDISRNFSPCEYIRWRCYTNYWKLDFITGKTRKVFIYIRIIIRHQSSTGNSFNSVISTSSQSSSQNSFH